MRFILASSSSERKRLFKFFNMPFEVFSANCDESEKKQEKPKDYVIRVALMKNEMAAMQFSDAYILSADTVVIAGRKILHKTQNREEAYQHLQLLSGRRHCVYTAMVLRGPDQKIFSKLVQAKVVFSMLSEAQIQNFLNTQEWENKAGSYDILGTACCFIRQLIGNHTTINGLPMFQLSQLLRGVGLIP